MTQGSRCCHFDDTGSGRFPGIHECMVSVRIFTIDGPVELEVQGFWMSTSGRDVVIRGDVPRKFQLSPGEGVLFDPTPLEAAQRLEGTHPRIILTVGTQELRLDGAQVEMRGVTLAFRETATMNGELDDPSAITSVR